MDTKMPMNLAELKRKTLTRLLLGLPAIGLMFFLTAGTLRYWQAWVFMAFLCFITIFSFAYFIRHDPELLERRIRMKEKEPVQKWIATCSFPFVLAAFLLPGFDRRIGWSSVPISVEIVALILVLAGYLLFFFVIKENRFASRIIQVEEGQQVINTGPYAVIRHPLYAASLIAYLSMPLALGSWWALLPSLIWPPLLIVRTLYEERVLAAKLDGYLEYTKQVKYRLIPGIW
jgi:protein-S-isoprenylcysteine O-methyltransferase Ste14